MKRIMLKASGESLKGNKEFGFDDTIIKELVDQVSKVMKDKNEVLLLVGGGNFLRGGDLVHIDRYKADMIGMMSTMLNGVYLAEIFKNSGIKTMVYGTFECADIVHKFDKDEIIKKLSEGYLVLLTGGTGHPYFTTDTGVVLRAIELDCDEVLLAKNIDYVYDSNPKENKDAKPYKEITFDEYLSKDLKVIDTTSAILAKNNNMVLKLFSNKIKDGIVKTIQGENLGTIIKN